MTNYSQPIDKEICDNPCTRCTGDGMVWVGSDRHRRKALAFCGRCGGSGHEPAATAARADDPDTPHLFPAVRQPKL